MRDNDALVVDGISKSFGSLRAVDDLSFAVAAGETFGLLGPNGAGKTTAISIICGLLAPDDGTVRVGGTTIEPGSVKGRELIGYVPQEIALYPDMSGWDNLLFFARLYGLTGKSARARINEVLEVVGLSDRAGDRVDTYSGGMQRRLNIAAGLLHRPRLLILDEPTVGIDPQSRNAILDAVAELGVGGMSVLYTTHYMEEAERLCDRVAILDGGRMLAIGTRRELVALVEEHDQVMIRVTGNPQAAAAAVRSLPGVIDVDAADPQTITASVDDASRVLPSLLATIADEGLGLTQVEVVEPSLDTVFLHITGTALRD